jgi:hypothetical protein
MEMVVAPECACGNPNAKRSKAQRLFTPQSVKRHLACQSCGKLIDSDKARFGTDVIRKWKKDAIDEAFKAIATSDGPNRPSVVIRLDEADREFLRSLALPPGDECRCGNSQNASGCRK